MTATKSLLKRVGALAMAMALTCVLAVSAGAAETNSSTETCSVTFYKRSGTGISMANDAVAGQATVTTAEDGSIEVVIPIAPLYNYTAMGIFTADGYLTRVTMPSATGTIVATSANTGSRAGTPYATANLIIPADGMPADGRFVVTDSMINLYNVGTSNTYWMRHVTPAFVIALSL